MGRELQKRKNRSSRPKIVVPNRCKKQLNPIGNSIIAKNWDKKQTLTQNYRRLGLASRLQAPTGGIEIPLSAAATGTAHQLTKNPSSATVTDLSPAVISEVRVERDENGNIIKVLNGNSIHKPLNDPLAKFDSDSESNSNLKTPISKFKPKKLEETKWEEWHGLDSPTIAATPVIQHLLCQSQASPVKKSRFQSPEESAWLAQLVAKYGNDTRKMAWDRKLNPYQQTETDITKRLKRWRAAQAAAGQEK